MFLLTTIPLIYLQYKVQPHITGAAIALLGFLFYISWSVALKMTTSIQKSGIIILGLLLTVGSLMFLNELGVTDTSPQTETNVITPKLPEVTK
jgi:phosphoglycerol transferase MdoB-like AlkP superfamily enzyme